MSENKDGYKVYTYGGTHPDVGEYVNIGVIDDYAREFGEFDWGNGAGDKGECKWHKDLNAAEDYIKSHFNYEALKASGNITYSAPVADEYGAAVLNAKGWKQAQMKEKYSEKDEYAQAMAELESIGAFQSGWTEEEMRGVGEQHHIDSILEAPDDFDTSNDRESFDRLIYDVGLHAYSLESGDFDLNPQSVKDEVSSKMAQRLVNFSKSWDLYGHRDAYDSDEDAYEDMLKSVNDAKEMRMIQENIAEDYEEMFDEPSIYAEKKENTDAKETTVMSNESERNDIIGSGFDFSRSVSKEDSNQRQITREEARERIAQGEFSTDVEPFMSDEEKSNALLREQEEREDRLYEEQLAEEAKKAEAKSAQKQSNEPATDGFKPFKARRLPGGGTQYNGFQEDEKGNLVDDGFSFDEYDKDDEDENGGLGS